jgi:hypothetical protein
MVPDPRVEAIWLLGPNHKRIENLEERPSRFLLPRDWSKFEGKIFQNRSSTSG